MRKLLIILLFVTNIYANFVDVYRFDGIEAVQKKFEQVLTTKSYWDEYLQNIDTRYGYYESIDSVLVCDKNKKELTLYQKEKNRFSKDFESSVFVGKLSGAKEKEGDYKTPDGSYDLVQKLTKLDAFYGPLALVTSYPSTYDKINNKSGHGIWIHGLPEDKNRENFTQGCVALDNQKLKTLDKKIDYAKAVLLLSEDKLQEIPKDDMSLVLSQLFSWKYAWQTNDIEKYLDFYSKDFKTEDGTELDKFKKNKIRIFNKNEIKSIRFTNINISPYRENKDEKLFKIVFDEDFKTQYYKFNGKKELYVKLLADGKISIVTEN